MGHDRRPHLGEPAARTAGSATNAGSSRRLSNSAAAPLASKCSRQWTTGIANGAGGSGGPGGAARKVAAGQIW